VSILVKAGRYELREELGRGAMGVVYRAHDPVIGRDVAVKTMHLSEAGTGMSREELVGRFQTEARAAGLLTHPNIVVVFDAGEEEGIFYITMELVEGRSLQTMLDARQVFSLPRTMKLMDSADWHRANLARHGYAIVHVARASKGQTGGRTLRYFFPGRNPL
jgi:eukaryotic-like serine/threonine-protein kinase